MPHISEYYGTVVGRQVASWSYSLDGRFTIFFFYPNKSRSINDPLPDPEDIDFANLYCKIPTAIIRDFLCAIPARINVRPVHPEEAKDDQLPGYIFCEFVSFPTHNQKLILLETSDEFTNRKELQATRLEAAYKELEELRAAARPT